MSDGLDEKSDQFRGPKVPWVGGGVKMGGGDVVEFSEVVEVRLSKSEKPSGRLGKEKWHGVVV